MSGEVKSRDRRVFTVKGLLVAWPLVFFGFFGAWLFGYDVTLLELRVDRAYRQQLDGAALAAWADPIFASEGDPAWLDLRPPLPGEISVRDVRYQGGENPFVRLRAVELDGRSSGWIDGTLRDEKTSPEVRRIGPRVFRIPRLRKE